MLRGFSWRSSRTASTKPEALSILPLQSWSSSAEKIQARIQINFEGVPAINLTAWLEMQGNEEFMKVEEIWLTPPCPVHEQWWETKKQFVFDTMKDRLIKASMGVRN